MKVAGIILFVLGLVGVIIYGIQAVSDSETFNLFGIDIAVSSANWTPVIISGAVMIIGIVMTVSRKKAT